MFQDFQNYVLGGNDKLLQPPPTNNPPQQPQQVPFEVGLPNRPLSYYDSDRVLTPSAPAALSPLILSREQSSTKKQANQWSFKACKDKDSVIDIVNIGCRGFQPWSLFTKKITCGGFGCTYFPADKLTEELQAKLEYWYGTSDIVLKLGFLPPSAIFDPDFEVKIAAGMGELGIGPRLYGALDIMCEGSVPGDACGNKKPNEKVFGYAMERLDIDGNSFSKLRGQAAKDIKTIALPAFIKQIKRLHQLNLVHGDLRWHRGNFMIKYKDHDKQKAEIERAVLIDWGYTMSRKGHQKALYPLPNDRLAVYQKMDQLLSTGNYVECIRFMYEQYHLFLENHDTQVMAHWFSNDFEKEKIFEIFMFLALCIRPSATKTGLKQLVGRSDTFAECFFETAEEAYEAFKRYYRDWTPPKESIPPQIPIFDPEQNYNFRKKALALRVNEKTNSPVGSSGSNTTDEDGDIIMSSGPKYQPPVKQQQQQQKPIAVPAPVPFQLALPPQKKQIQVRFKADPAAGINKRYGEVNEERVLRRNVAKVKRYSPSEALGIKKDPGYFKLRKQKL